MSTASPRLELDWEMGVFKALRALWRAVAPVAPPAFDASRAAVWKDHAGSLRAFAQMIAGAPIPVQEVQGGGGVRGHELLVPAWIDRGADPELNRALYVVRLAIDATRVRDGVRATGDEVTDFVRGLETARAAIEALASDLPRFSDAYADAAMLELTTRPDIATLRGRDALEEVCLQDALRGGRPWEDRTLVARLRNAPRQGPARPPVVLWGRLVPAPPQRTDAQPGSDADEPRSRSDGTEAAAPPVEDLTLVSLTDKKPMELPTHSFEKVETAESFNGTMRQLDGDDELEEHLEALHEVQLSHLVRGGPDAHSVLKADVALDIDVPDVAHIAPTERAVMYDEWDRGKRAYRKAWCAVYPTPMSPGDGAWARAAVLRHRRLIDVLHERLQRHRAALRPQDRQLDGEDVDVDALVDALATVAAGHEPSPRLYVRQARQRRDVATTVLLDVSLSTDSWVDNRRVLDVAREAVLVLGEVADRLGDRLQVLAFASHTRNQVRVWHVRDWRDPWSIGKARLGRLEPQGYTRIGPALRHAIAELRKAEATERVLLLVSDGKPTDYDRYEGRYGMSDVRQALTEARQDGVHVHALAIDAVAREALPAIFGAGAWSILPHPDRLPEALTKVYGRFT
jgi:nitric oxide reductase NorD protein